MDRPQNGIYIIQGEVNLMVIAMRRNSRWTSHSHHDEEQDPLLKKFSHLKDILNTAAELAEIAPNEFLDPFLEVIRSEDTTGPITGLALTSVNKFLSYRLIDSNCETAAAAIENIADAVTHARFVGTDPSADEIVLMKILHVLRTLLLTPVGAMLTNEAVCEIMQSCFRICFEMRLSDLLRKSAEHTLMDMVQLLFSRLPQFKEDPKWATNLRKLKMRASGMESTRGPKFKKKSPKSRRQGVNQQSHIVATGGTSIHSNPQGAAVSQTESEVPPDGSHDESAVEPGDGSIPPTDSVSIPIECTEEIATESQPSLEIDGEQKKFSPAVPPNSLPTSPPSDLTSPDSDYLDNPVIATTPVAPGGNIVQMHESYHEMSDSEMTSDSGAGHRMSLHVGESTPNGDLDAQEVREDSHEVGEGVLPGPATQVLLVPSDDDGASDDTKQYDMVEAAGHTEDTGSTYSAAEHSDGAHSGPESEYINPRGVRFTPQPQINREGMGPLIPHGLPCVRELFRFLISLTNPLDHSSDVMIHMGLSLLSVALESGADNISSFNSLLSLVKDDLCKNLFMLLQSERLSLFAASMRACFLLFESMRCHLKFQLEMYLNKLMEIMTSELPRISYEQREIALEAIVQLLRIPGFVTELYLNYDCDLFCSNLFEDLMKLLSKNAFPVSGLFSTHLLSLDALLAVIDSIEQHCHHRVLTNPRPTPTHDADGNPLTEGKGPTESMTPPIPPACGYNMADKMAATLEERQAAADKKGSSKEVRSGPRIRPNRMKVSEHIPSEDQLNAIKYKKKLYHTGTEQFNVKPSKGISFLQEHGLLSTPLNPTEVGNFLKKNPALDKKQIGEYISARKNSVILEAFQKSFNFKNVRLDEALRVYLETFRLPGEAPVISMLLEHFADHWHVLNGSPFLNSDAAFTLAFAVIMLNTDQHNTNAKKQNVPMTCEEFKKNLAKVNGGRDFDQDMLDEVFGAIKNDEIVMPAEQTGLVKDNYMWKVLMRRGCTGEGSFMHVPTGAFDRELFTIVWGPSVAALSFVFDKSLDDNIIQKAVTGFRKCAVISAHYGISDVFDNLVISLCKFTTLLSSAETAENIPVLFGNNSKAQLAARTVFSLAQRHGDILREGWKNIFDCMLQLFRAKLLPDMLVKAEDFLDTSGKINLIREEAAAPQRSEAGVLSNIYSYFTLTEPAPQRGPSPEEQEAIRKAQKCLQACQVELLITESKFLRGESLQELIKALIFDSRCPDAQDSLNGSTNCEEDSSVFFLELLIKVVLYNRDRIAPFWQSIRDHLYSLVVNTTETTFLVERAVVGLLRLAIRLLRREEIAPQVLRSMQILLMMRPSVIHRVSRHLAYGLHDLLKTNAANIHRTADWYTLFTCLEVVGAGTSPPPLVQVGAGVNIKESMSDAGAQSDSEIASVSSRQLVSDTDRGYTSDSELYGTSEGSAPSHCDDPEVKPAPDLQGSWMLVYNREQADGTTPTLLPVNQYTINLPEELSQHDPKSLTKCCETLAFLVRDAAHVTPLNFESCVHAIRTFVEASINGGYATRRSHISADLTNNKPSRKNRHKHKKDERMKRSKSSPIHLTQMHDSDEEKESDGYQTLSIQLLDLMHTLHTRAATIYSSWAEEGRSHEPLPGEMSELGEEYEEETIDAGTSALWTKCWCPLLQGIARLCCDSRRNVRSQALTYLQRALLVHDLQTLSAIEWESCFNKVLFPLLSKLLDSINPQDPTGIEETRMRASTLLCKVFLQHLTPLLQLTTFTALWLTILEFMDKYMHADSSDLLCEAIPESLKNMLLVMHTAGILQSDHPNAQMWRLTWDRIDTFLPTLRGEVFKSHDIAEPRGTKGVPASESQDTTSALPQQQEQQQPVATQQPQQKQTPENMQRQQQQLYLYALQQQQAAVAAVAATNAQVNNSAATTEDTGSPPHGGCSPLPHSTGATGPQPILHPPRPSTIPHTVPLLLNPDVIQGTAIPYISPQSTPERKPEVAADGH